MNEILKKNYLRKWKSQGLEKLIENSCYRNRAEAIGNNQTITYVFEILHERGKIDCETAYCFDFDCPKKEKKDMNPENNKEITQNINKQLGSLTVITGPMFAGKTTTLIDKYENISPLRSCLVFKPKQDTRYSSDEIVSHNGKKEKALLITNFAEINLIHLKDKPEIKDIIIDELQFFPADSYVYLEELVKKGIRITLAGLDWDYFQDKPFEVTANCLAIANGVFKLTAECDYKSSGNIIADRECNLPATKSGWKLTQLPKIPEDYVGGMEKYGSYCPWHYISIKQKETDWNLGERQCGVNKKEDCESCQ